MHLTPLLSQLVLSRRLRQTPFEPRAREHNARAYTIYNHMPLACSYESPEADYHHLCQQVQIWDVACERQVEVSGVDALKLVELVTPRAVASSRIGECRYAPLVDEFGGIVNDPIIIRLAATRFWLSTADSDVLLWLKGINYGRGYDAQVFEPEVSPLAVQGPKATDLMADLLGEAVRELRFFHFITARLADTEVIIARSGWGGQGGFEIYLQDSARGLALWDCIWAAGEKYQIRAGCPNHIDRIESGLLSYGNDMTLANNPYECGLARFIDLHKEAEYMARAALTRIAAAGAEKSLAYLTLAGAPLSAPRTELPVLDATGRDIGILTSMAYSPKFATNLAFATVATAANQHGAIVQVEVGEKTPRAARVVNRQWQ